MVTDVKERFFGNVKGDFFGGLTAGVVALPLALGFGVASGIGNLAIDGVPISGALAGMIGAIVVGIMASVFGGTPAQVSGPTGPLTVVSAGLISEVTGDPRWVFAAIALSGAFQIAFGLLRIGRYINYIPYPVISGFMSGIGVIIIILSLPQLLGAPAVGNPVTAVLALPEAAGKLNVVALVIGLATIAVVYVTPRVTKAVPGTLVALVVMTLIAVGADAAITSSRGLEWREPVLVADFVGEADAATLNGLGLAEEDAGHSFIVGPGRATIEGRVHADGEGIPGIAVAAPAVDAAATTGADGRFASDSEPGLLTAGDVRVEPGDVVEWDGAGWTVLHAGLDGAPVEGVRVVLATDVPLRAPFAADDAGRVAEFDGESRTPALQTPAEGWTVLVAGKDGHEENHVYVFDGEGWSETPNVHVPSIGNIPTGLPSVRLPDAVDWGQVWLILPFSLMLAALASIDSLLTSLVADTITKTRHDSERELIGQGIGNMIAGAVGGLPGAGATMRTVINVKSGGRSPLSGVIHGAFLLAVLLGLGPLAERIPQTVLAGILITVGIGIVDYKGLRHVLKVPRGDAGVMVVVLLLTVFVDLMTAVAVGMVMASILLVKRLSDVDPATHSPLLDIAAHRPWIPDLEVPEEVAKGIYVVELHGSLFFGNAGPLQRKLGRLTEAEVVVLRMHEVRHLDQSGVYALQDLIQELGAAGTSVYLTDLHEEPRDMLSELEVAPGIVPADHVLQTGEEGVAAAVARIKAELAGAGGAGGGASAAEEEAPGGDGEEPPE